MKRYHRGGDISYWSKDRIQLFNFMQSLGVPRKDDMLRVMISVLSFSHRRPRLLEIGGGLGAFTGMVLKKFPDARLVFVDGSEDMICNARRRLRRYRADPTFIQTDINQPGWYKQISGLFDAVVSTWCIHYLADDRQKPFFREVYRLIRPAGLFLFSCSIHPPARKFLQMYNGLEIKRIQQSFKKQGMDISVEQIKEMARKGHNRARINPACFDTYCLLMKQAGFSASACVWKYLFNTVFAAYKGKGRQQLLS